MPKDFQLFILTVDLQLSYQIVLRQCWDAACEFQRNVDALLVEDFVEANTYYRAGQIIRNQ